MCLYVCMFLKCIHFIHGTHTYARIRCLCIHKLVTPSKLNYDMLHYKHRFKHCFDVLPVLLDNATKTTTITSNDTPNDRGSFCFFATWTLGNKGIYICNFFCHEHLNAIKMWLKPCKDDIISFRICQRLPTVVDLFIDLFCGIDVTHHPDAWDQPKAINKLHFEQFINYNLHIPNHI